MKILVIGCGSIGSRHIRNLKSLGVKELLACDVRQDRAARVSSEHGVEAVTDMNRAWRSAPEAALITAPTSLHLALALHAAEQGCHLFIEKPLADGLNGLEQLLEKVRRKDLVTLVGCNLRFHPGLLRIKSLLEDDAIGKPLSLRAEFGQYLPDWHPGEDYTANYSARRDLGGGVILDAIHEIDYARWLMGEVTLVACLAGKLSRLKIETEDTAALLLRFDSGAFGEIHLDYVQRAYRRTCQIIGEEGTILWDYAQREVRWFRAGAKKWKVFRNPSGWQANDMYLDEMRHFLRCLERTEKPELDVFGAFRDLAIAAAAGNSSAAESFIRIRQ
ncbi:MAG TPA: Gfo/Idh/MocA family oxidoreductase [Syntrophales bacterium]|nr:Gfo/Idh/MocA family oxidoreductase [Syntrophales bacterium]